MEKELNEKRIIELKNKLNDAHKKKEEYSNSKKETLEIALLILFLEYLTMLLFLKDRSIINALIETLKLQKYAFIIPATGSLIILEQALNEYKAKKEENKIKIELKKIISKLKVNNNRNELQNNNLKNKKQEKIQEIKPIVERTQSNNLIKVKKRVR